MIAPNTSASTTIAPARLPPSTQYNAGGDAETVESIGTYDGSIELEFEFEFAAVP